MIPNTSLPLCIDLDGTLVREETLWILLRHLIQTRPSALLGLLYLFFRKGRAAFKKVLSEKVSLDPAALSYHQGLLSDLHKAFEQKRILVLATGADLQVAQKIADHLGLFHMVLASDGHQNLVGQAKAAVLARTFGATQFIYAGNSWKDVPVWELAAHMIVVNAPPKLIYLMEKKETADKKLQLYA